MKKCSICCVFLIGYLFAFCFIEICIADNIKGDIAQLKTDITKIKEEINDNTRDIHNFKQIYKWVKIGLGILGISSIIYIVSILSYINKKVKKTIDKAIYKVDPTYLEVKIPNKNFTDEKNRLKQLGFKNLKEYSYLDSSCVSGCVIYMIDKEEQIDALKKFLEDKKPDKYNVGYVIYTKKQITHELIEEYNNITFANTLLTLVNAVYTVARATVK